MSPVSPDSSSSTSGVATSKTSSALIGLQCHLCQRSFPGRSHLRLRKVPRTARAGVRLRRDQGHPRGNRDAGRKICGAIASCCRLRASRSPGSIRALRRSSDATAWPSGSGVRELYLKDDSVNHPTLSYKDRVVSVAATRAVELGFKVLSCASTGNLANSVAAHAARLGLECCVFIPDNLEPGKMLGSAIYQADHPRDRRQLRRCESAVHAGGGSLRMGVRQHQLAVVLRRGRQDDGLRDRRTARLALPAPRRVAGRGRHAAAAHSQGVS